MWDMVRHKAPCKTCVSTPTAFGSCSRLAWSLSDSCDAEVSVYFFHRSPKPNVEGDRSFHSLEVDTFISQRVLSEAPNGAAFAFQRGSLARRGGLCQSLSDVCSPHRSGKPVIADSAARGSFGSLQDQAMVLNLSVTHQTESAAADAIGFWKKPGHLDMVLRR